MNTRLLAMVPAVVATVLPMIILTFHCCYRRREQLHPPRRLSSSLVLLLLYAAPSVMAVLQIGYSSPAESGIMEELGLTMAAYSVFGSIMTVGGLVGAVLSGKIADLIGRRRTMWFSEVFCTAGWLAIAFAKNGLWLDIGRLSIGFEVAMICYVVIVLRCHSLPDTGPMFVFVPESPRWLAKNGRDNEFKTSLQHLRGMNADISQEAAEINDYTKNLQCRSEDRILDVFSSKYAHSVIVGVGLMLLQQMGGYKGFAYYANSIFDLAGFPSTTGVIAVAVTQVFMNILGILLIDTSGRRPLLMDSVVGTFLGCFLTLVSFLLQDLHLWEEITPVLALIGILMYMGFYSLGMSGIPWIIMSEIFPVNIKGSAGSLCNLVNWFCSWVVSYTFNFLLQWNSAGTFLIFSSISGVAIIFIAKLMPEAKGRTLEEIQASITRRVP